MSQSLNCASMEAHLQQFCNYSGHYDKYRNSHKEVTLSEKKTALATLYKAINAEMKLFEDNRTELGLLDKGFYSLHYKYLIHGHLTQMQVNTELKILGLKERINSTYAALKTRN